MFRLCCVLLSAGSVLCAAPATNWDREIVLAPHVGATTEDREIDRWQAQARRPEASPDAWERLGWAYIAKARRTLDAGFYALAEKTATVLATEFGPTPSARFLRAHALHQLHRFSEAADIARGLVAERGAPLDHALLSDVLIEQGNVADAIAPLERFAAQQPGPEAFSRIAHVRWLRGDLSGATAALEEAVRAGSPRQAEAHAWLLARLSWDRLRSGAIQDALGWADRACAVVVDYPPALLARGRALAATRQWDLAVVPLRAAAELSGLSEYQWWLADVMREAGDESGAAAVERELAARGAATDARTLSLFLATRGRDPALAVRLAREELRTRADVFSHDALAWALLAHGEHKEADAAMRRALAEHTKDARLFLHAGEVARANGRLDEARSHFAEARTMAGTLLPSEHALLTRRLADAGSNDMKVSHEITNR